MSSELSPLEKELVLLTASENWPDFRMDGLQVLKRENTGAGRFVYLGDVYKQALPNGMHSAQGRIIQMQGVKNGLGFVISVVSSRINHIEMFTYGNVAWDGREDSWSIL